MFHKVKKQPQTLAFATQIRIDQIGQPDSDLSIHIYHVQLSMVDKMKPPLCAMPWGYAYVLIMLCDYRT